jgi:hypothetical protein
VKKLLKYGGRLWAYWIQFWWIDLLLAATVTVILRQLLRPATGADVLGQLDLADRRAAYTNMLQVTAIFAGFSGVGFTIYLGLGSRSVHQIKSTAGMPLLRIWVAALVTPWACTLILVFCDITDRGGRASDNVSRWVAIGALALVVLQLVRIIWVFYQLAATDLDSPHSPAISNNEVKVRPRQSRGDRARTQM